MFKIKQEIADHDRIALEVEWVGTLAISLGSMPAEGQMKAGITTVSRPGSKRDGKMGVLVRGYCYRTRFCGTVPPLSWKKQATIIWVCGQGSCYSPLVCCFVALAPC